MSESYERLLEQKKTIEARAAERAEQARWIAVTPNTMPPPNTRVLAFSGCVQVARWNGTRWSTVPGQYGIAEPVTHWQPLPLPPVLP